MNPSDQLIVPEEVILFPVAELAPSVRAAIGCDPDDYALTRKRSRRTTRVVDRAAADLIEEFRRPCSVIDAIRSFTLREGLRAEEVAEACVPLLNEMISDGFIVAVGTEQAADGDQLRAGDAFGGWEVVEPVQLVEDTEVYRVQSSGGVEGALKRVFADAEPWVVSALRNELRVLGRLSGPTSPSLLEDGSAAEDPYIVISWCEGTPVASAAARIRRPWSDEARAGVAELCIAVLDAYVDLHRQGVIHGDVHPRNLLFDGERRRVHVIDYGLARLAGDEPETGKPAGGVPPFFTPEYAAATLAHAPPPQPTAASEQYSLAALLYSLITGEQYLQQVLEGRRWLEAVCARPPREFSRLAIPPSSAIESALGRALSKDPDRRFASMAEFRARFADAVDADRRRRPSGPGAARSWTAPGLFPALASRLDLAGGGESLLSRPTATVNYGSAGIAYLLYRAACVQERADLLALADVWIERAKRALGESPADACFDPGMGLTADTVGTTALYHSAAGVHCVDALVACAIGDRDRAEAAFERFAGVAGGSEPRDDLTTGRAGHLLGCASLVEAARAAGFAEGPLLDLGRRRRAELTAAWRSCADVVSGAGEAYLGIAHGWAGVAFALLRFRAVSLEPVAPETAAILAELERLARGHGGRAWWPRGPEDEEVWPGWCHGSAGHAMLWAQAHRVLADDRSLELARMAAEHAWSEPAANGQLCCGSAGQAYASLCLHRLTGDGIYVDRARKLLDRSMMFIGSAGMTPNSLYKGDVGVALLEAELAEPFLSAMPLFESEGWPLG